MTFRPQVVLRSARWVPLLLALGAFSGLRAENRPLELTLIGGSYGAPMRPSALANVVDDGFGFNAQLTVKPVRVLGFFVGGERTRFYKPGQFSFLAGTLDVGARLVLPKMLGGTGYLQGGAGFNVLGEGNSHWDGKTCGRLILGKRIEVAPGFGFDLAAGYHSMGKPEAFKYADVRAGMVIGLGRDKDPEEKRAETPSPTPKAGSPTPVGTVAPVKGSPTPMNVPSATPTPNVIILEGEPVPTFTPTVTGTTGAVTLVMSVADRTMKETYDAAFRAYQAKKYATAIRLWKKALAIRDATQFWYYAEANAMIGATYHYKMVPPNKTLARQYYLAALRIDPATKTAKRGLARLNAAAKPKPKPTPKPAAKPQDDLSDEALGLKPAASPAP